MSIPTSLASRLPCFRDPRRGHSGFGEFIAAKISKDAIR